MLKFGAGFVAGFAVLFVLILIFGDYEDEPRVSAQPAMQPTSSAVRVAIADTSQAMESAPTPTPMPTYTPMPPITPAPSPTAVPTRVPTAGYSAPDIIHEFRTAGLPIGNILEFAAETDPNSLLGRPNQYIQKISWKDTRVETQGEPGTSAGGTVEVFLTVADMEARKNYVASTSQIASFLSEYSFSNGIVLVRLTHDLTPEQAKDYEDVLMNLSPRN